MPKKTDESLLGIPKENYKSPEKRRQVKKNLDWYKYKYQKLRNLIDNII